jgi:alkaline phosphatase
MTSQSLRVLTFFFVVNLVFVLPKGTGQENPSPAGDALANLQVQAVTATNAAWGHWGVKPNSYSFWTNHSNRLIPIYVFGDQFQQFMNEGSVYRNESALRQLYGKLPEQTLNPDASYADQTDVYRLQRQAIERGKKYVFLIVFDGMDWQTTWAAATYRAKKVRYDTGRGIGLRFQDYRGAPSTDFGFFVTSPHDDHLQGNVNKQTILPPTKILFGGYNAQLAGSTPWSVPADVEYLIGRNVKVPHAFTDSSSSASSMTAGVKTYNGSINVMPDGTQVETIAHWVQREKNMAVGAVTSVPISHATPAATYAHNVARDDFQDLTRDMIGLKSIAHPTNPLPGLDVVIGCGYGESILEAGGQGVNWLPGNRYLTDYDQKAVSLEGNGKYVVVERRPGINGRESLAAAANKAAREHHRLLGFFGVKGGQLPFQTANGDYKPVRDVKDAKEYSAADISENPILADMATAAIEVLSQNPNGFWLMIEAGDVDWANHANNIDSSVGAVLSGDFAFEKVVEWIEAKQAWNDSIVIVTADHGHYFHLSQPQAIAEAAAKSSLAK